MRLGSNVKRAESLAQSFGFAFQGIWYALNTQRNLRIHFLAAAVVLVLGWFLDLPERSFMSVLTAIMVVMVAELVNTAVESVVDLASPDFHALAKTAKDVAAGAVLLAALGAAALGVWVFVPRVFQLPERVVLRFDYHPVLATILVVVVAAIAGLVLWIPARKSGTQAAGDRP